MIGSPSRVCKERSDGIAIVRTSFATIVLAKLLVRNRVTYDRRGENPQVIKGGHHDKRDALCMCMTKSRFLGHFSGVCRTISTFWR